MESVLDSLKQGKKVLGYAFSTLQQQWKKDQVNFFGLYYGQIEHPTLGPIGLPDAEVGKAVVECLEKQGVRYRWDSNPKRPICVETASIAELT